MHIYRQIHEKNKDLVVLDSPDCHLSRITQSPGGGVVSAKRIPAFKPLCPVPRTTLHLCGCLLAHDTLGCGGKCAVEKEGPSSRLLQNLVTSGPMFTLYGSAFQAPKTSVMIPDTLYILLRLEFVRLHHNMSTHQLSVD